MIFERIDNEIKKIEGHVGYYFYDLVNNESYGYNQDDEFLAASVIKLPIYACICKLVHEGKASFNDEIIIKQEDFLSSCGGINCFTHDVTLNIETLCNLMIRLSDNTATNTLINYFGMNNLNNEFNNIGLNKTHIYRLLFDSKAASLGLENKICLSELGDLLKAIYDKTFINAEISTYINDCLLKQQINHKIPGYFKSEVKVAHKTGEDTNLSNDVGIVYASNPFILCFAGHDTDVPIWEKFIRQTSRDLLDKYNEKR